MRVTLSIMGGHGGYGRLFRPEYIVPESPWLGWFICFFPPFSACLLSIALFLVEDMKTNVSRRSRVLYHAKAVDHGVISWHEATDRIQSV